MAKYIDKEADIINEFAKDIGCLNPIYEELSDINFFEILKIDQMELRHSNFLAWLLNPASPSGIGDKLLKRLLLFCSENNNKNAKAGNTLDAVNIELMDLDDVVVKREHPTSKTVEEKKKIDLLISSEKGNFCICVENKIKSSEHTDQLHNYYKYVEEHFARKNTKYTKYKYENRYYILLSPKGIEAEKANDKDIWAALSYADIYDWVTELLLTYDTNIPLKAKTFIVDYLNALQRHIIEGPIKEKCEKIYMAYADAFAIFEKYRNKYDPEKPDTSVGFKLYDKHRDAIDLVLDNRTELTEKIKLRLIDALRESGHYVAYDPKRAPAYMKVPKELTSDERLVDFTCDDITGDFIFYELYYAPGEKCYYVNLRCQMDKCPAGFDSAGYGKELNKYVLITSKKISRINKEKTFDYITELERNPKEPSKEDVFIQALCKEIIKVMTMDRAKEECQKMSKAIK